MKIYVDIDETICSSPPDHDYSKAEPIHGNIKRINELYDEGHEITYWTARGSVTGKDWRKVTEGQLKRWGCKYHKVEMGKPSFDIFIDDKVVNSRVWEKKGNDVLRRVFLQNKQRDRDKLERAQSPPGKKKMLGLQFGMDPTDPAVVFKRKFRWVFEAEFPKDVKIVPYVVQVDKRPSLNMEEEVAEKDGIDCLQFVKGLGEQEWEPIKVKFLGIQPEDDINDHLATIFSATFNNNDWDDRNEDFIGSVALTLYDGAGNPVECWKLKEVWFQSVNLGDLGDMFIDIELTLRYKNVIYKNMKKEDKYEDN